MPAVIRAIGMPCMALGTLVRASCSRIPEKMISASAKPIEVEMAKTTDCNRLKSF